MPIAQMCVHDWVLIGIEMDWTGATAAIGFVDGASSPKTLVAEGLRRLVVDRDLPWGFSVSVHEMIGPVALEDGVFGLELRLQSGDRLRLEAERFVWSRPLVAAAGDESAGSGQGRPHFEGRDT
ncbi:hypothetical protein K4L06_02125 [Lysobacter sp. BMK333-48F3]|uniref:hypothetical protein n=1 Tax=Lysobacter sp. BMK333-48F3 TaxID=2867962 RepID=UPI001C8C7865|nr:hypothetical protein [Lysobacter sp. BMK333-48F3]MBX9400091.1 hypothetical protein [Lysobacter sp. BMK333-48F3]